MMGELCYSMFQQIVHDHITLGACKSPCSRRVLVLWVLQMSNNFCSESFKSLYCNETCHFFGGPQGDDAKSKCGSRVT